MADPKLTREQYLELRLQGKTRKEIAKQHDYTLSHLENYWLKKWDIKDPIQEEVAIAEAFAPASSEGEPAGSTAPDNHTAPTGLIAYNTALEDLAAKIKRLEAERDDFASGILERDREISKLMQAIATVTEDFEKAGKVSEQQWQERVKALEKSIAELEIEREMLLSTIELAATPTPETEGDPVNHPAHYTAGSIEAIDAIEAALTGLSGGQAYNTGAAIKYLWRWSRKGGAEDLRKARWYIDRLLAGLEADAG